jgi:hypothetical protein
MTEQADDDEGDLAPEQIASELKRIADRVRQGPFDSAEQKQLIAAIETLAKRVSLSSTVGPAIAQHLDELADELRNAPLKRKNGPAA